MRRVLALVSVTVFVDAMLYGVLTPLVPGYVDDFHLSKFRAGLLVGSYGAGALVGGIPGGLLAGRSGPKRAVVLGLLLLSGSSFAFALAASPLALSVTRFVQGVSSTTTWAGALAWITVTAPRERRGQLLGTAFGFAVLGAILGPTFGAVAKLLGIRGTFLVVGLGALALATAAVLSPNATPETVVRGALRRALGDPAFHVGLWLNTLPAFFAGVLYVLVPLAFAARGHGAFAIGGVFLVAGLLEAAVNPVVGRVADRRGRLAPIRIALVGGVVSSALLAWAAHSAALPIAVVMASLAFSSLYTPGIALVSDRADTTGLTQGLAFGVMNSAWAVGQVSGAPLAGALAGATGDAVAYLVCAALCVLTLGGIASRERISRRATA